MDVVNSYRTVQQIKRDEAILRIKWLIWIYFWLLIFEGAVRKWILPEYATPLLIIRDPFLVIIYFFSLRERIFPFNGFSLWLLGIGVLSFGVSLFADDSSIVVSLYGFRVNYFHFPLIFIMMSILGRDDVLKIGRAVMILAFPMALLMMLQFMSPPDAWINSTAGGQGFQIRATIGNVRPPGTFSFVTGVAEFLPLVTAFLVYYALVDAKPRFLLTSMATMGLIGACIVSISRLAITCVCLVLLVGAIAGTMKTNRTLRMFVGAFFILFIVALLAQFDVIRIGFSTFGDRIQAAGGSEGGWMGYVKRITKVFYDAMVVLPDLDISGYGLGMGTQGGAALITGKRAFLLAEGEWSRVVFESGPILGVSFLAWRVCLGVVIFLKSINCLRNGDILPLLLFSACIPLLTIGQLGRATTLGFTVFSTGLCLAAIASSTYRKDDIRWQK